MNFRYDINGLRAIAVLAVVVYHFNPEFLTGGFAGVDVFFVISGFLMTKIIFESIENNKFNLINFYVARANRIIPTLAIMSLVLIIFGWFYLLPTDYQELGKQLESSSIFFSNQYFSEGGGYFDTAEHTKWLLHTWSLSVEWQFYILYPIFIVILKKYLKNSQVKLAILALTIFSFILCLYLTFKDAGDSYFLLTSRTWELLVGSLAYLYPWSFKKLIKRKIIQFLGCIVVFISYFTISKDTLWPGYMTLIPVSGAYLIIVSNFNNSFLINPNHG